MTKEEAEFVNKLCESYQKDSPLPHGNQVDGSELCKEAQKIINKI